MLTGRLRGLGVAVLTVVLVACGSTPASPAPATPTPGLLVPSGAPSVPAPSDAPATPSASDAIAPRPTVALPRPLGARGGIVVLGEDGSLAVLAADGRSAILDTVDPSFVFPAWSPDGRRVAAVRTAADGTSIVVYDAEAAIAGDPSEPRVIYRNATMRPFYLSWTPDGAHVSYLASSDEGLALRLAPADASSPTDGTESTSIVRFGNPFYYDWIGPEELYAHVGSGQTAFLGELDRAGESISPAVEGPADFRAPAISPDGAYLADVRAGADGPEVVLQARDGGAAVSMPVHAMAAVAFDPVGDRLAAVGPDAPVDAQLALPLGPVRLLDARTGETRTLIDGAVVSFWWSPDGSTMAALRAQPIEGGEDGENEARLLFVDVATGEIRSQSVVRPGQLYIDQFLTYFDQYARSHQVWAPDASSFLMPIVDPDGSTRLVVFFPDGSDPVAIEGIIGFWSP